ncbi:hypothetical protein JCM3766R1_000008 [Sporobolomyces carnicolor]
MDSPYSPLEASSRSSPRHSHAHGPAQAPPGSASHSPPLVPIPPNHRHDPVDASYDPNYLRHSSSSRHASDPYAHHYRDPYASRGGGGGGYAEDWRYHHYDSRSYHQPPYDAYHRGHPAGGRDPYGYPPPRDPYGYHYGSGYGAPPPPRDPYYYDQHPRGYSHAPYAGPPPPPPPSVPPSTSVPPPVAAATPVATVPFPLSSTAVSLGPHPIYGHLDPSSDLSIPILYLARPIATKTFGPLKTRFQETLELRFVNSLLELERDLRIVEAQDLAKRQREEEANKLRADAEEGEEGEERETGPQQNKADDGTATASGSSPEKKHPRRRIWITAVGGTDALVQKIWQQTREKIEWKEIVDLQHLQLELMWEDKRVSEIWSEQDEQERAARRGGEEEGETAEPAEAPPARDPEWEEQERGRKEIEQRELESGQSRPGPQEVEELDRVLRAVRGENGERPTPRDGYDDPYRRDDTSARQARGSETSPVVEPSRLGTSRNGERGEVVVDRFENMATREHHHQHYAEGHYPHHAPQYAPHHAPHYAPHQQVAHGDGWDRRSEEAGTGSRKRTRQESAEDQDHTALRAARKKLEAICKAPRRNCVEWAKANEVAVNEETRMVDQEPVLGERHRGVWDLFGHELDDVSPQIQVLMARTMRDVTYPPRLRLYSSPEAVEQLEETVPWFTTLLKTIQDRYELAGAASVAPQDPPVSENPLAIEGSTAMRTDSAAAAGPAA